MSCGCLESPLVGRGVATAFGRAAELFEHADLGVASTIRVQQCRQRLWRGPVFRQHDRLAAAAHRGVRGCPVTRLITSVSCTFQPMRAHASVTAETCGSTLHFFGAVQADQAAADAVQQRVAAGDDVDVAVMAVEQCLQRRQQRRRPLFAVRGHRVVEQAELSLSAVNDCCPA